MISVAQVWLLFFFEYCMFYVFMYIFYPWLDSSTSEATRIAETSRDAARDAATAKSAGTMWCLGDEDLLEGDLSMDFSMVDRQ